MRIINEFITKLQSFKTEEKEGAKGSKNLNKLIDSITGKVSDLFGIKNGKSEMKAKTASNKLAHSNAPHASKLPGALDIKNASVQRHYDRPAGEIQKAVLSHPELKNFWEARSPEWKGNVLTALAANGISGDEFAAFIQQLQQNSLSKNRDMLVSDSEKAPDIIVKYIQVKKASNNDNAVYNFDADLAASGYRHLLKAKE